MIVRHGRIPGLVWVRDHAVGIHAYGGCPSRSVRIHQAVFDSTRTWKVSERDGLSKPRSRRNITERNQDENYALTWHRLL